MSDTLVDFLRRTSDAARRRTAYEARQTLRAGDIEIVAQVRARPPDRLIVTYDAYKNPLAEWSERMGLGFAPAADDLVGTSLVYDGRTTWHVSAKTGVSTVRPGRALAEPLPDIDALGEVGFLADLARDALVRDLGEDTVGGRVRRIVAIKPKRERAAHLLRVTTYPYERATLTLDAESLFPTQIRFLPAASSSLRLLLGDREVVIEYENVREGIPDEAAFAPPDMPGMRVFRESATARGDIPAGWPFPADVEPLIKLGYRVAEGASWVGKEDDADRGYAFSTWLPPSETPRGTLMLRVGNFLSRDMARRRAWIGEHGEEIELGSRTGRWLDRRSLWPEGAPVPADVPSILDVSWDADGVFWILSAEGIDAATLRDLATNLATR